MKLEIGGDMEHIQNLLNRIAINCDHAIGDMNSNWLASAGVKVNEALEARNELWRIIVEEGKVD